MKLASILFFLFALIFLALFIFSRTASQEKRSGGTVIKLGKTQITVELADSEAERMRGLSGRTSLPQNAGMLFVFGGKGYYSFWMKDMKFPLDFVWIDGNRVVELTQNVPYPKDGQSPAAIVPKEVVDKVLEVNAGVIDSSGVKIGNQIDGL